MANCSNEAKRSVNPALRLLDDVRREMIDRGYKCVSAYAPLTQLTISLLVPNTFSPVDVEAKELEAEVLLDRMRNFVEAYRACINQLDSNMLTAICNAAGVTTGSQLATKQAIEDEIQLHEDRYKHYDTLCQSQVQILRLSKTKGWRNLGTELRGKLESLGVWPEE